MKLISLTANQSTFHTVNFSSGLNIIVGKQALPYKENDGKTYNGVGKSLLVHLIHFCMGSNKITALETALPEWEFSLEFEENDKRYVLTRSTEKQEVVIFNGSELKLKDVRERLLTLCFGLNDSPKNMTLNTLLSRFVRRYRSCYSTFDSYTVKEQDYSKLLNNCFLLGLDIDLIVKKQALREKQKAAMTTYKAIKKDKLFKEYYLGDSNPEIDEVDLEYNISKTENELSKFKVSQNYHELEKEANDKSYDKKRLENQRVLINNNIKNIKSSLQEATDGNIKQIIDLYEAANVEIPGLISKELNDVIAFHSELISSRNNRLRGELKKQEDKQKEIDKEILIIGGEMDELLAYLNTHGALEEYITLVNKITDLKAKLNRIHEYQNILKAYKQSELDIKSEYISNNKATEQYLTDNNILIAKLRSDFSTYAKEFYPKKKCGLIINNNDAENTIRYNLDAKIEDDSSDGVNEVKMFCFDLLILNQMVSSMRFVLHDSRLFANMDPRQREKAFSIAGKMCDEKDVQYICTINEDALSSFEYLLGKKQYEKEILDNIILELNDDSPESKLLGIQVDLELEE